MLGAITASLTPKGAFIIYVACKGFRTLNLKKEIKIKKKKSIQLSSSAAVQTP